MSVEIPVESERNVCAFNPVADKMKIEKRMTNEVRSFMLLSHIEYLLFFVRDKFVK